MKKKILVIPTVTALAALGIFVSMQCLFHKQPKEVYSDPFAGVSEQGVETVKNTESNQKEISKINEDYYDIKFDLAKKEAIVDGDTKKISELLSISDQTVDSLISNNLLASYLKYHLIGNVSEHNGEIAVNNPYSTDALIVKGGSVDELRSHSDIKSVKQVAGNYYVVKYDSATKTKAGYAELLKNHRIDGVATDSRASISGKINNVEKTDNNELSTKVEAVASGYEAWGVESMGANHYTLKLLMGGRDDEVSVAVLDTGINATHDAFKEDEPSDRLDMTYSHDYVNDDDDPTDDNGHGTQVAGVIVESTPANVKVVPVKVMDDTGHGDFSNIIVAVSEISEHVDVINMSLGMEETENNTEVVAYFNEILAAIDPSVVMVAASGNESASKSNFPASSPSVWSIGAVDSNNVVADFSNHDMEVDFTAPGVDLKLPYHTGNNVYAIDVDGTSFSSPFVAASVAMLKADNPEYTASEIYSILRNNAVDLGDPGKDEYYGYGSIDFDTDMFKQPVFAAILNGEDWSAEQDTVTVGVVSNSTISKVALFDGYVTPGPEDWSEVDNDKDYLIFNFGVAENGTYYIWVMDANGNVSMETTTTDHIDTDAPVVVEQISRDSASDKTLTAKILVDEQKSGISSAEWTIVNNTTSESKTETDEHGGATQGKVGDKVELTHKFLNLTADTQYTVSARVSDLTGHTLSTPAVVLSTTPTGQNPVDTDISINLTDVLSLALLNSSDPTEAVDSLDISLVPNGGPKTTSLIVRSSGNTDYNVAIEMEGAETGLVEVEDSSRKIIGTETDNVTMANMQNDSWGFSLDATNFSKVPANGAAKNIGTFAFGDSYHDTTVTFGSKITSATSPGNYTGNIVFTVVPNE